MKKKIPRRRSIRRRFHRKRKIGMKQIETRVVRGMSQLLPDRLRIPMGWNDTYNFQVAALGAPFQYAWRVNSPYDPDQPVGISQKSAYGFNTMGDFYKQYRCFGSKIVITAINQSATAGQEILIGLYPSAQLINTTTDPNVKTTCEKPYAKRLLLGVSAGPSKGTIKHYASVKKLFGVSSIEFEDNFSGSNASDPFNEAYWNLNVDAHGQNAQPTVTLDVQIVFYVEWYNRNPLGPTS